jgi:DNA-directed RNA polymerase specialized sigma24 family protein
MESDFEQPTRWSVVWRAGHGDSGEMRLAREELARIYWQPVFQHVRSTGLSSERAEDLTQGFFEHIIKRNLFANAQRDRGRLRAYFFIILRRYLINEWRHERRHEGHFPLHDDDESPSAVINAAPDHAFDRAWALATIHGALEDTKAAYVATDRAELFEQLRPFLVPDESDGDADYARLAELTGKSEGALRTAVSRLRSDFRAHLSSLVARTLDHPTPEAVREEIRDLLHCL